MNVEKWFEFDESTNIEEQAKYFIAETVESYLNGCYDNPDEYTPETIESWKDYVWNTIIIEQSTCGANSQYKHLYFYGKDKIMKLTEVYLANYKDVQPYII